MRLFYASLEIALLATIKAIHLVIQIPLRIERRTYLIYAPFTPIPRVFIFPTVYQSGEGVNSNGSVKSYSNHTVLILHRLTSCILLYS
jgi:hypothetical protein